MHLVLLLLLSEMKYNMLCKGGCTTTHFQLIICTFFQQHSILYSVVKVKGEPVTYCNFRGNYKVE